MRNIALVVALAVVLTACGGDTTTTDPPEDSSSDTAAIYAAALRQMVVDDNTFGGGGNPFSELLVQTSQDPGAGGPEPRQDEVRPLNDDERDAIEAALSPLADFRWIDDPDEWRTDDLMPVIEGSAILGVGPITFDGEGALVPMSMWCGGLCGTWFTYRAAETVDGWAIVDIEGPIAVS